MDGLGILFERRRWGLRNTVIELCTRHAVTVASLLFAGEIICKAGPNVKTNPATEIDDYRVQIRVRVGSKTCPMQKRYRNRYAPTD